LESKFLHHFSKFFANKFHFTPFLHQMIEKLQEFLKSCVNEKTLQPLQIQGFKKL